MAHPSTHTQTHANTHACSEWYVYYFFAFLVATTFVFLQIVTAIVFDAYQRTAEDQYRRDRLAAGIDITEVFNLLKTFTDGRPHVDREAWMTLFTTLESRLLTQRKSHTTEARSKGGKGGGGCCVVSSRHPF